MPPEGTQNLPKSNRHKKLKVVLLVLLVIGLLAGAFFVGKYKGNKTTATDDSTKSSTSASKKTTNDQPSKQDMPAAETVKYVESIGYLFNAKRKVATQLGLPTVFDAVVIHSGNQNRGAEQLLTDKYNDELGRWVIGYRDERSFYGPSEVSILAIGDSWLNATANGEDQVIDDGTTKIEVKTPQQKKKYIADLKAQTLACSKDAAKGFQTNDKTFNICSTVNYGIDGFAPTISLKGYAEIEGKPVVLIGYVEVRDGKDYAADSSSQLLKDAKAGKPPVTIAALITAINEALRKTTTKVTDNPLVQ